jgi:nucleoside-diphosphate-sugar epimerase
MTETKTSHKKPNILITGGSGFLGKRIVEEFLMADAPLQPGLIRVFDINDYEGKYVDQIEFVKGDIRDYDLLEKACEGIDIVIHAAAIIDWGTKSKEEVLTVNAGGTENVINVCKKMGIKHLAVTSSLDAVFTGKPLVDIDETQVYPDIHATVYCESKKLTELAALRANNENLKVVILRPADIYGEADPYHIDSLIDMAKKGFYVRLGNGKSSCQHVYVGNMAYAHVLAATALWTGNDKVPGQIYFITDGKGANFFKFFDQVVIGAGYKIFPENLWLPRGLAYSIGALSEGIAVIMRPIKKYNPKFSRFAVTYTCTDYTFSAKKAENDFGFKPKYSNKQAMENTVAYYKNLNTGK